MTFAGHKDSVPDLLSRLIEDAKAAASAELNLRKIRLTDRIAAYKTAMIFFAVAGVLALAALIALLVGAILSLATLIGPGFATLAVVFGVLLIAGVLAMIGKARLAPPAPVGDAA
ncbi:MULTISPECIES: phage holin family protein [unclassified Sphingomonas]|uniref:phage holin family protein n=1 Tax=unclassified Sphingomonas TaxID=196159 RepID=UPI001F596C79|nr:MULTISPECIES: phage holin family protein [unclassified Sphingomonas]